ncbi:MAG: site-2 protease family protein [Gemmataceae bacterium]|nr:site-2 protease family protein [Gemmataceae bacterium]
MRDPFSWSLPLGQLFGIAVRMHVLLPVVMVGMVLRFAISKDFESTPGIWIDVSLLMGLLFVSVLLHELGHCFAARSVEGDAREILLWPLGGLAYVDVPNTPRAHLWTALGGPLVNIALCIVSALLLGFATEGYRPPTWFEFPTRWSPLIPWGTASSGMTWWTLGLAQVFWINWFLALLNLFLVAWPLDGARILQAILWPRMGYRSSMAMSIRVGFVFVFIVLLYAVVKNESIALGLALFIYMSCKQEYIALETGGEESLFGYDFSQGYTSLEKDAASTIETKKKKQGFIQRWLKKRRLAKMQRDKEQQEAEELRMDELLEKINRFGKNSLTDEETRFLKRVSDRYKNRS